MDLLQLFNPSYTFNSVPGAEFAYRWVAYGFFALLFAVSFYVRLYLSKRPHAKVERSFFSGLPSRMREFAVLGLVFTFFRDQNIPYMGMRAWILLIVLGFIVYLLYIWRDYRKNFPLRLATLSTAKKVEDKYLPKRKK